MNIMDQTSSSNWKTLICLVCYEAEKEITAVLDRIPAHIWDSPEYHVLVSDDASTDNTAHTAYTALHERADNVTIQVLDVNQGYGGNQKACYLAALEGGYDSVVLLHGDGQYPPEMIDDMVASMRRGNHVVLGSRMMVKRQALEGGMPLYKFFGNIILTRIQNYFAGRRLHEFHTGFRAYRADLLEDIPFELNSDDFHFDTEILLQSFHWGGRVEEIPIPTHYGDEICRVDGIKYALAVLKASYLFRMQQLGLHVSLQYPRSANQLYKDKTLDSNSTHARALAYIRKRGDIAAVLDIGCGPGHIARRISKSGVKVDGIDLYEPETPEAFATFQRRDLNALELPWPTEDRAYDLILLLDVVEHLDDPENFLLSLRHSINQKEKPTLLISVPNVAFILMRLNLLLGRFNYADRGILDISHRRFFTRRTLLRLLAETGYEVKSLRGVGVPFQSLSNNPLFRLAGRLSAALAALWPSLFAFQFFCEVSVKLTTKQVLTGAKLYRRKSETV